MRAPRRGVSLDGIFGAPADSLTDGANAQVRIAGACFGLKQPLARRLCMDLRQLTGYACAVLDLALAIGGIWAARYYSLGSRHARMRAKERKEARERAKRRVPGDCNGATNKAPPEYWCRTNQSPARASGATPRMLGGMPHAQITRCSNAGFREKWRRVNQARFRDAPCMVRRHRRRELKRPRGRLHSREGKGQTVLGTAILGRLHSAVLEWSGGHSH